MKKKRKKKKLSNTGGAPPKLTKETQDKLVKAILSGATYDLACCYAGISYQSFRNWMIKGEQQQNKKNGDRFFEFFDAIKRADGKHAMNCLKMIDMASISNWQAAAWKLERRYPKDYAKRTYESTIKNDPDADDEFDPATASTEELEKRRVEYIKKNKANRN